jgi:hypothetical protein
MAAREIRAVPNSGLLVSVLIGFIAVIVIFLLIPRKGKIRTETATKQNSFTGKVGLKG